MNFRRGGVSTPLIKKEQNMLCLLVVSVRAFGTLDHQASNKFQVCKVYISFCEFCNFFDHRASNGW